MLGPELDRVARQFRLSGSMIDAVVAAEAEAIDAARMPPAQPLGCGMSRPGRSLRAGYLGSRW
jgi:hypothetical protein